MTTKMPPFTLGDFSYGHNDRDDASLIPDNALAAVENFNLGRGYLLLRDGTSRYTPEALGSAIKQLYTFFRNDGTNELLAVSNQTLYKDSAGTMSPIPAQRFVIVEDCDDAWDELVAASVTVTSDPDAKVGTACVKLAVAAGVAANTLLSTEAMTAINISGGNAIRLWIKSSISTVAGDLQLLLDDTSKCVSPVLTLNIPALVANTWTQVTLPYTSGVAGSEAIISVGLKYVTDLGECSIWLDEIEARFDDTLASSTTSMLTYKDRFLNDMVLIADGGRLKAYDPVSQTVTEVVPHKPTPGADGEEFDPGQNDLVNLLTFRSVAIKQDRIFALAHDIVKNRISFCHHDPDLGYAVFDYWPANHFYDMVSELNDESIALRTFRNAIMVFNRRTVWMLTGDGRTIADYDLRRINVPSGLLAPDSIAYVGNYLFYLSDVHVYALYSTDRDYISAEVVSRDIETTLKSIPLEDRKKAVGSYHDGKYILSFPSGKTVVLDTMLPSEMNKYGAWTTWTNIKANCFLDRDGTLCFSTEDGLILKFDPDALNDDGQTIMAVARTKRTDFGYPVQVKKFKRFWIVAKQYEELSSDFNLTVIIDDFRKEINGVSTDESAVWDEGEWDDVTWDFKDVVQKRLRVSERGKTIQFEITHESSNQPFTLYKIVSLYKLKKAK